MIGRERLLIQPNKPDEQMTRCVPDIAEEITDHSLVKGEWILLATIVDDLKVQMNTCLAIATTSISHLANLRALLDLFTHASVELTHVSIQRLEAIAMIDDDHTTIATVPATLALYDRTIG